MRLKAGEYVEVRSREEILATVDDDACFENLPFMPEMLRYCGKTLRVASSAHKTCDTVAQTGGRRMRDAVHLEDVRCDGSAHGGCEAGCLIFWKHAWLKNPKDSAQSSERPTYAQWDDARLAATTQGSTTGNGPVYRCQATTLLDATEPLHWWDLRQYFVDLRSRNVTVGQLIGALFFAVFNHIAKIGFGHRALIRAYDCVQSLRGGTRYPFRTGQLPDGARTPIETLGLQPGDTVRVKSHEEILATLDASGKNRGMSFDAEMVPYCGTTHRVHHRVNRIIHESSGKMIEMKTPCIVLDGVVCRSRYSSGRFFCPRAIYSYWRESWLERVDGDGAQASSNPD